MKQKFIKTGIFIFVLVVALIAVFPIVFVMTNSLMSESEMMERYSPDYMYENGNTPVDGEIPFVKFTLIPKFITFSQYKILLFQSPVYLRLFWNSIILILPILLGQCFISPLAAYGFEQLQWRYKEVLYFIYLIVMLMPMQLLLVPQFLVADWFGINQSYLAIILPAIFHPMGVFLIRQQIKTFPVECLEAARMDGSGEWKVYREIVLPCLKSIVAALAVLLFADNWNIVDQAVVFIRNPYAEPLSLYLNRIVNDNPGIFFGVSVFYLIPALLIFLIGEDYLITGISLSGVKK